MNGDLTFLLFLFFLSQHVARVGLAVRIGIPVDA
jgi:hypothetical protein